MTIQKGCPYSSEMTITTDSGTAYNLTGKTVLFTVKKLKDNSPDDTNALITQSIAVHTTPASGITTLSLTLTQTNIPFGRYKGDCRVMDGVTVIGNTDTFYVEVTDIVTKRTV